MTTVSVVIPVWNRAHSVGRAIESALAQQLIGASVQVLVIDDGSSDDLARVLRCWSAQVAHIRHDRNRGAAAARNTGIAAARGDYVAFLDSDDIWLPGKLAEQIAFMHANGYLASCTSYYLARKSLPEIVSPGYPSGPLGVSDLVWGSFVSPGSTLICARNVFSEIGGYDVSLQRLEDWDWLLRFARTRPLGFLARPLARIEASGHANAQQVLLALRMLKERYASQLAPIDRRHFSAAAEFERAAAYYRESRYIPAFAALLNSLRLAPIGHVGLKAILHNRLMGT
jgi:glycosyltransferase involved in cell wall biosynthesis